jgi:hypothetical protein
LHKWCLPPEGLNVNRKTQLVLLGKLQRSDIKLLTIAHLRSKKERNYLRIQPNRSAGFFRLNLRELFFYADQRRKKSLIYLRYFSMLICGNYFFSVRRGG